MNCDNPHCTPGLKFYQRMMDKNHQLRVWNQERLRHLCKTHSDEIKIFCSHDTLEFEKLAGHSADVSATNLLKQKFENRSPDLKDWHRLS